MVNIMLVTIWRPIRNLLLALGLSVLGFACAAAAQEPSPAYTVVVNHAPPYRITATATEQAEFSGLYIDIIRALAEDVGIRLEFVKVPFARALVMMEVGTADLMLGPNRTDPRERFMAYLPTPIDQEPKIFVVRDDGAVVHEYESLTGQSVGVLDDSVYFDRFDIDPDIQKIRVSDYETAFKMLVARRFDAVIVPERLGLYLMRDHDGLAVSPYMEPGRPSFIAISRQSELMGRFDQLDAQLDRLMRSPIVNKLQMSYQ